MRNQNPRLRRRSFLGRVAGGALGLNWASRWAVAQGADANTGQAVRVGLANVSIVPKQPVWLHGYAGRSRFRPYEGVLDDIHAKAMAVESAGGQKAVLITADLCVLRGPEELLLSKRILDRTGLGRQQILLCWSHTHSGPILGATDLDRYPMSDEDKRRTLAYTEELADKLAALAVAALADLRPASLSFGRGQAEFVKCRRQYDARGKYRGMGPNPDLPVDRTVPVLRVDTPEGELRGLVFGCACHAVTLGPESIKLSGDYPGMAQQCLEKGLPGVQAMFVAGCGADANTDPRCGPRQEQTVRQQGEALAAEVRRVAEGRLDPVRGPLGVQLEWADLPLQTSPASEELERLAKGPFWQSLNAKRMLAAQERGERLPTHYRAPLALWQFGADLTLAAISGEVVSDYVPLVQKALGPERLWIAGYSNQVFGYLPSARIVAEGGYESLGLPSGPIGWFSPKAQDAVVTELRKMAQKAGRPGGQRNLGSAHPTAVLYLSYDAS